MGTSKSVESEPDGRALLKKLSDGLSSVISQASESTVRVDDGSRLSATGIVWTDDGVIATTSHGVERDDNLSVETADGNVLAATLVGRDPQTDIAVLRVKTSNLKPIGRAGQQDVRVGELVVAIGRPSGSRPQATLGTVSAMVEARHRGAPEYVLHTDAVLYPGFSGGPLVNTEAQMLGMINLIYGRSSGVALGTPIVEQVTQTLLAHGKVPRGYVGIRTQTVSLPESVKASLSPTQEYGLLLILVEPNGPASAAGLVLGDTLLTANGKVLSDVEDLRPHLQEGEKVSFKVLRAGVATQLDVAVGSI